MTNKTMPPNPAEHPDAVPECSFADAQRANLRAWVSLSASAKIDFFEEMVELAYQSGALSPARLALRDRRPASSGAAR